MAKRSGTRKLLDEQSQVRCKSGSYGILREKVYVDHSNTVVKYSLAFIHHLLCQKDHGRVLGYDNAHGCHERHWMGSATIVEFASYEQVRTRFLDEVAIMKEQS